MADFAVRAAAVSGGDLVARLGVQFLVTIVLARILTPADFGAVALAMVVIGVLTAVADVGARTFVVRHPELDDETIATVFWSVLAWGTTLSVLTALAAPVLESLTGTPRSGEILRGLAPVIVLNAIGGLSAGLLARDLRFGSLSLVGVAASVAGGAVALMFASQTAGPWPLVAMTTVTSAVYAIGATAAQRPPLRLRPNLRRLEPLLTFGRYVVGITLLDAAAIRVPLVAVGLRGGIADAGQYSRADSVSQALKEVIDSVLGRVALPMLARSGSDDAAYVAGLRTGYRVGMGVFGPFLLAIAAVGTPLTVALFGGQWTAAGPLLSALAVGAAVWPINVMAINGLLARGRGREVLALDVRNKAVLVLSAAVGALSGPMGVAIGVAVAQVVAALFNMQAVAREAPYPWRTQLHDASPMPAIALPWAAVTAWTASTWEAPVFVVAPTLLLACLGGTALTAQLCGVDVLRELIGRLRHVSPL